MIYFLFGICFLISVFSVCISIYTYRLLQNAFTGLSFLHDQYIELLKEFNSGKKESDFNKIAGIPIFSDN